VALNRERLIWPLVVRYFQAGDRFWPLGAPGPRKLQDFLVDCKIPRWLRPHIPLVVSGGQIVWVAGLRTAEPLKVSAAGDAILTLAVSPTRPESRRLWEVILDCHQRRL
jgi:tRNA(Ile)-lysidine synthase